MGRILVLLIFLLVIYFPVVAQKKKANFKFHSINSIALVNGSNSNSAALQSIAGFSGSHLFAGVGAGLDYYLYRSIPVFMDIRYELGNKSNKFFAYADAGINFSWVQEDYLFEPIIWNGNSSNSFHNGIYTDAGFGYAVAMKNGNALILSLGYSHKRLKEKITHTDWRTQELQTDYNIYGLNRIMIKAGWRF
jgi:hypothetical protein